MHCQKTASFGRCFDYGLQPPLNMTDTPPENQPDKIIIHMKQTLTYLCGLAAALLLVACHDDNAPATEEGTAKATFRIYTRANVSPGTDQQAALYVAERRQEDEQDELYCSARHDVGNGSYLLENLGGQWYKLAFVCVPNSVTLPDIPADHAFNNLLLDYTPVLKKQNQQEDADLAIYRHIIDRWLRPGEQLTEDVTLSRITGQLILDMGILKDQFPTQVTKIEIALTDVPSQVYLRNNANGEIIYPTDNGTGTYTYTYEQIQWDSNDHFRACLNLLPHTLKEAKVTVTLVDGTDKGITFSLVSGKHDGTEKADIVVFANTRTTVYFRGMEADEFEVRYAGFDGSGIGVADDEWNGWS